MTKQNQHEAFMWRCIELAKSAVENGNIGVGSLVVQDDQIIAEASEILPGSNDIIGHAEILAVRAACGQRNSLDLSGCTLYTTAEPCWMCSYAIREARVSQVVIGTHTLDVGGISSGYPLLTDPHIAVWEAPPHIIMGILAAECARIRNEGCK